MKNILFVTSSSGKVVSLSNRLKGTSYKVIQKDAELPEIQANTSVEVSIEKAKCAYELYKKPLIVQDSSFHIVALKGFPGVYAKYINHTIGPEGIIKLMEEFSDRRCYFFGALTYIDESIIKTFTSPKYMGLLSDHIFDANLSNASWSYYWKIFIPEGSKKVLAAATDKERSERYEHIDDNSEFKQFINWLDKTK